MNIRIEAAKYVPETAFEKKIDEIKAGHAKGITSLDTNISAITFNKTYLSSEHLNADVMPWIILKQLKCQPNSSTIFSPWTLTETPNFTSKNGGLLLDQHFINPFFDQTFVSTSQQTESYPQQKKIKETVHFFNNTMIHPSTVPKSNVKLKRLSEVYHVLYSDCAGKKKHQNYNAKNYPWETSVRSYITFIWIYVGCLF